MHHVGKTPSCCHAWNGDLFLCPLCVLERAITPYGTLQKGPAKRMQSWLKPKCAPAEGKSVPSRNRLVQNWIYRCERHFHDICKNISWPKKPAETKNWLWNLLTKRWSADNKNLLTESANKNKICWQETASYTACLRKERLLVMENILKYLHS